MQDDPPKSSAPGHDLKVLLSQLPAVTDDSPVLHRLGHHVIGLLLAARESGDERLVEMAEDIAVEAGRALAKAIKRSSN